MRKQTEVTIYRETEDDEIEYTFIAKGEENPPEPDVGIFNSYVDDFELFYQDETPVEDKFYDLLTDEENEYICEILSEA